MKKVILFFLLWSISVSASEIEQEAAPRPMWTTLASQAKSVVAKLAATIYDSAVAKKEEPTEEEREQAYKVMIKYVNQLPLVLRGEVLCELFHKQRRNEIAAHHLRKLWQEDKSAKGLWRSYYQGFCDESQESIFMRLVNDDAERSTVEVSDLILSLLPLLDINQLGVISSDLSQREDDYSKLVRVYVEGKLTDYINALNMKQPVPEFNPVAKAQVDQLAALYHDPAEFFPLLHATMQNFNEEQKMAFLTYLVLGYGSSSVSRANLAISILNIIALEDMFSEPFPAANMQQRRNMFLKLYKTFEKAYPYTSQIADIINVNELDARAAMKQVLLMDLVQIDAMLLIFYVQHQNYEQAAQVIADLPQGYINILLITLFGESFININDRFKNLPDNEKIHFFDKIIALSAPYALNESTFINFVATIARAHADYGVKKDFFDMMKNSIIPLIPVDKIPEYSLLLNEGYAFMKEEKRFEQSLEA